MSFITSPGVIVPPLTAGGVAYGTGSQAKVTSAGTVGQVLTSAGAGVPVWANSIAIPVTVPNGGTGLTTLTQNNVILGNGGSTPNFVAPGASGNVLTSSGSTWASAAPPAAGFTLATPVASTSGTAINFTGIPTGVKQIIVMFRSVSTDSGSRILVQIGDAGGIETTGYLGARAKLVDATSPTLNSNTEGFETSYNDGSFFIHGQIIISLENSTNNIWVASGVIGTTNGDQIYVQGNSKALSQVLDRLRITTQAGTANFDNGEINISYI